MNPVASLGDGRAVVLHAITRPNQQQLSGVCPHSHLVLLTLVSPVILDILESWAQALDPLSQSPTTSYSLCPPPKYTAVVWGKGQILTLFAVLPTEAQRTVTQVRVPPVHTGAPVLA